MPSLLSELQLCPLILVIPPDYDNTPVTYIAKIIIDMYPFALIYQRNLDIKLWGGFSKYNPENGRGVSHLACFWPAGLS